MSDETTCPLCSSTLKNPSRYSQHGDAEYFDCPRCGTYLLDGYTKHDSRLGKNKHLVSAWIRRQHKLGTEIPIVAIRSEGPEPGIFDAITQIGLPKTVNDRLDTLLKAYADIVQDDFRKIISSQQYLYLIPEVAVKDIGDIYGLNQLLNQLGYIQLQSSIRDSNLTITAKGWFHIEELKSAAIESNYAFIAMWYDSCTEDYRKSVIAAVKYCGYNPIIIDSVDYNDFIMNEVINLIRQSRFIIADLTCLPEIDDSDNPKVLQGVRGGVYWEAGLAFGLGKPVIQTCKKSDESKRRVHFDLDQYPTIYWEDSDLSFDIRDIRSPITKPNFAEILANRILVLAGRGTIS